MFELIVGRDAVQRRTGEPFDGRPQRPARPKRATVLRLGVASRLHALADRIEPVGAGRASEPAGAYPR